MATGQNGEAPVQEPIGMPTETEEDAEEEFEKESDKVKSDYGSDVWRQIRESVLKERGTPGGKDRGRTSLGSIKPEPFRGSRHADEYRKWKKQMEALRQLYRLDDSEMALLVYMATQNEARECLDILEIEDLSREGGLELVYSILDSAFDKNATEKYDEAADDYRDWKRTPG